MTESLLYLLQKKLASNFEEKMVGYMKKIFFIIFVIGTFFGWAETSADLSSRIVIDGNSSDFTQDENILVDSLGNLLELPNDSRWGEYNDVRQIKVTWDENNLYVAVDACSWDNNVMLFLDIYDDYGVWDMQELNTWKRAFKFYNLNPDFFLATWDTNNNPQFWKMREGSSLQADEVTIEDFSTFDTGNLDRSMEAAIPWETLYYNENRTMEEFPAIKFLAIITSKDDNKSGPDSAPDNLGGMSEQADQMIVLDNYVKITVDENGDGMVDLGIEPNTRTEYFKKPPFKAQPLEVQKVNFENGKIFAPMQGDILRFQLKTNRASVFDVEIFDIKGKKLGTAKYSDVQDVEGVQKWEWDGKDKKGKFVPFGIYLLRFVAESGEVSHKEAIAVVK